MQIFEDNPEFQLTATSVTQDYNIIGAIGLSWDQIKAALLNYAPVSNAPASSQYQWPRRAMSMREIDGTSGIWKASITWSSLIYQYATEIGGSQQQIRCDLSVVNAYANSSLPNPTSVPGFYTAGTLGAAIGFDGRTVHGASIYIPTRTWTESVEIPVAQYTFDYEDAVATVNGAPVNKLSFRGYQPGDVLFQGMQAQLNTGNPDFVTASFKFSQQWGNRSNSAQGLALPTLSIGGITGIQKDGWDYLDVRYQASIDSTANTLVPTAQYVLIHRVYNRSDFTPLNIGTGETLPTWQGPPTS